ncbi:MAG: ABC transporter permease subunit, partial [Chloroflexi bacterium]|nr:ABC transporter permease subunit [Chloroflexota bacterium]
VTNAERDGTLDVMLSLPVKRRDYLLARFVNTAWTTLAVLGACFGVLVLATVIWPEFDVNIGKLAQGIFGAFFLIMAVAGPAYMLTVLVPSSKRWAGPVAYLYLVGSYLLFSLSVMIETLEKFKPVFIFNYYSIGPIMRDGADLGDWLVLAAVALAGFGVAWWYFDRKQLGV